MPKRTTDRTAPFQSIRNTSYITGYSQNAIRAGCKKHEIPHVMVGKEYRINIPLFLEILEKKSRESLKLDTKKVHTSDCSASVDRGGNDGLQGVLPVSHYNTDIEVGASLD